MSVPSFFGSLFGELIPGRDCSSIEQDPHADPFDKEICQQFHNFSSAFGEGFSVEHRSPEEGRDDVGEQECKTDPQSLRDSILNRPRERREEVPHRWPGLHRNQPRVDEDLDESVRKDPRLLDQFLTEDEETVKRKPSLPRFHSSHSSTSVVITTRPDGTYEERRTTRDSDGNAEVTVTYSDGKQTHTERHRTARDGTTVSSTEEKVHEGHDGPYGIRSRIADWLGYK